MRIIYCPSMNGRNGRTGRDTPVGFQVRNREAVIRDRFQDKKRMVTRTGRRGLEHQGAAGIGSKHGGHGNDYFTVDCVTQGSAGGLVAAGDDEDVWAYDDEGEK